MTYRLRITIEPPRAWTCVNLSDAIRRDVERLDAHPEVSTLLLPDGAQRRELVAVKDVEGDEARAGKRLFRVGVLLNNGGWRVHRLRIDTDVATTRALYHETRIKIGEGMMERARSMGFKFSALKEDVYATLQSADRAWLDDRATALLFHSWCLQGLDKIEPPRIFEHPSIRAVVHDTAPEENAS